MSGLNVHSHALGISVEHFLDNKTFFYSWTTCSVYNLIVKVGMITSYTNFSYGLDLKNITTKIKNFTMSFSKGNN